jgi:hypothetical protein
VKKHIALTILALILAIAPANADITVRLELPAKTAYQVLARNYILKGLLSLEGVILVESGEQYRLDMMVKELVSSKNEVTGLTIAAYLLYRVNWASVRELLMRDKKITENDTSLFDKLPSDVYFPVAFASDYATVGDLRNACMRIIEAFNREHFDKSRARQSAQQ